MLLRVGNQSQELLLFFAIVKLITYEEEEEKVYSLYQTRFCGKFSFFFGVVKPGNSQKKGLCVFFSRVGGAPGFTTVHACQVTEAVSGLYFENRHFQRCRMFRA